MSGIMEREPALVIQLVSAVVVVLIAFGVEVTRQEQLAIEQLVGVVVAIMVASGLLTRSRVWCPLSVGRVTEEAYRRGTEAGRAEG